jgi:TatD DNase family protein
MAGFLAQIKLADEHNLPLFLHNRNTTGDFLRVCETQRGSGCMRAGGVVHSFDGSAEEMRALVDLGFYIGINGCSLRTEENLLVAATVPADRLMLETDAPWCGIKPSHAGSAHLKTSFPNKKREKYQLGFTVKDRSEPCHIVQVLEVLAAVRGVDEALLAEQVWTNTHRLFFDASGVEHE